MNQESGLRIRVDIDCNRIRPTIKKNLIGSDPQDENRSDPLNNSVIFFLKPYPIRTNYPDMNPVRCKNHFVFTVQFSLDIYVAV